MQGVILLDLIVVEELHLGHELALIFRIGIGLGLRGGRTTGFGLRHGLSEIEGKGIFAHLPHQSTEKVVPDAIQVGLPVRHFGRRLGGGIRISGRFDGVAGLRRTVIGSLAESAYSDRYGSDGIND